MARLACLVALVAFLLPPAAHAQDRKSVVAYRLVEGDVLSLDGRVDEAFWERAEVLTDFVQSAPVEGGTPSEQTEIRIAFDSHNLYLGAIFYDSDPDGILGFQKERDAFLTTDDRFMWILDTFQDGRTGYFFETNPAGLMGDALLGGGGFGSGHAWDGIWEAQTSRGAYGWSAEVRIPFSTLNFNPDRDTWGINFQRTVRRKNEEILWSGHLRNQGLRDPIFAGQVTGLTSLSQGLGLEARPYAVGSWRNIPDAEDATTFDGDIGLDVTYSITSSLRAALTVNTDFAEVEADQRRVNLTRFPLFFPEKRDFFLEGSGVFGFSPRNGVTPFFSRRIGLSGGEPIPIRYGARLAGQAGKFDIGFLQVRTGQKGDVAAEDFTVGRVKRFIGEQSSLGLIYTRRAPEALGDDPAPEAQQTIGTDLELTTRRFRGDKNLNFQAFLITHNRNPGDTTSDFWDRTTRGIRLMYPNDPWSVHASYREFGDAFDPALGFNRRNGFRRFQPTLSFEPRLPQSDLIRELAFEIEFEHLMDLDFKRLTQSLELTLLGVEFESGDQVNLGSSYEAERLDDPFNIFDEIEITVGDYDFYNVFLFGRTASRRKVSARSELAYGTFWSGTRTRHELGVGIRPMPGVSLEPSWEINRVDLPGGTFTTNVFEFEGGWQFNPWVALTTIIQYDDVSELLSLFTRFRWIVDPGNDLYLIFTHNWQNESTFRERGRDLLIPISRGGAVKVNYTRRF